MVWIASWLVVYGWDTDWLVG